MTDKVRVYVTHSAFKQFRGERSSFTAEILEDDPKTYSLLRAIEDIDDVTGSLTLSWWVGSIPPWELPEFTFIKSRQVGIQE